MALVEKDTARDRKLLVRLVEEKDLSYERSGLAC
ncbi:hypothetical protein V6Z11_A10G159800 [Gossypium hirsutum]